MAPERSINAGTHSRRYNFRAEKIRNDVAHQMGHTNLELIIRLTREGSEDPSGWHFRLTSFSPGLEEIMERATGVEPATSSLGTRRIDLRENLATIGGLWRRYPTPPVVFVPLSSHDFPPIPRRV